MPEFYFTKFETRMPPCPSTPTKQMEFWWHCAAGLTLGLGFWYLSWRWTQSINADAMWFSLPVLLAETLGYIGCLLFFHDIWRKVETPQRTPPTDRKSIGLSGTGPIDVDIFVTTYNEDPDLVALTIKDAKSVCVPPGMQVIVHLLDDGNRSAMSALAKNTRVNYVTRTDNSGFKAGNLRNALLQTSGDFIVICDADSRLFPDFLQNTLGYFHDPKVAWVQTPHWFYDIPDGKSWREHLDKISHKTIPGAARLLHWLTGSKKSAGDPFLSNPGLFFDIIQKGRNRSGASFCCGAGSIHRREAVFATALTQFIQESRHHQHTVKCVSDTSNFSVLTSELQPFRFHVSEDIYTSILLHSDKRNSWKSVYHPKVECKMLSPWDMAAWTVQRTKYAAGTFDIMFKTNLLFKRSMPLKLRLHYAATFWSYLTSLWQPILLLAPIVTLSLGIAPVTAYSGAFFLHLVPFLLANELALILGCWGHDVQKGRALAIACIPINISAFFHTLSGRISEFKPTPKKPIIQRQIKTVVPHLTLIGATIMAVFFGLYQFYSGVSEYSSALIVTNVFWASWNIYCLSAAPRAAFWRGSLPPAEQTAPPVPQKRVAHASS